MDSGLIFRKPKEMSNYVIDICYYPYQLRLQGHVLFEAEISCCAVAYYSRLYLTGKASPRVNLGTLYIPQFLNVATTVE